MKKIICGLAAGLVLFTGCFGGSTSGSSSSAASSSAEISSSLPTSGSDTVPSSSSKPPPASSSVASSSSLPSLSSSTSVLPASFKLTIPEGYTLARIGMTLEEMGICTTQEFIDAAQNGDFSGYSLAAQQAANENRCFKLEGYLFPDTYEFYSTATPTDIIRTMLNNTEKRLSEEIRQQIAQSGYTADEILTLASIIQKEAYGNEEMPNISSVLHNRLDTGWQLQCDVTITYVEGAIKPFITGDVNRYNSFYNTYKCPALPAGAICNPGMAAILAALAPADTDYMFFLTDADNNFYYATTLEEHEANKRAAGIT